MLKRILGKFRPTPASSMAVALLGVIVALSGTGWAANGGAFILGIINSATQRTALVANFNGSTLQVNNASAAALAVPLQLTATASHPPMKVNTATKVANLNADYLDGLDSTALTRVLNVPNNLGPSSTSAPIFLPVINRALLVVGVETAQPSVGQATLFRFPGTLSWVGIDSTGSGITGGTSTTPGTHIVYLDSGHNVDIEVGGSNAIQVHNDSLSTRAGTVTFMW